MNPSVASSATEPNHDYFDAGSDQEAYSSYKADLIEVLQRIRFKMQ